MKTRPSIFRAVLLLVQFSTWAACGSTQVDLHGPSGSEEFGRQVTVLPNGSFVVTDPLYDQPDPWVANVGAVYLYSADGQLTGTLAGTSTEDNVGSGGVQVIANGNFVVRSPLWDNGGQSDAGAVTWGSATTGFIDGPSALLSSDNSLVGTSSNDAVGSNAVTLLTNGHYLVRSPEWDNGPSNVGAVTWCNGLTGTTGDVSLGNSLIGSQADDMVGGGEIAVLTNGNYVVQSIFWDGALLDVGAVTWCNGGNGIPYGESGPGVAVSTANSLVGGTNYDLVGSSGVTALTNGHYVVASSYWNNPMGAITDAGAVTWCDGGTGRAGTVLPTNSLTGSVNQDQVGRDGVTALTNGSYVVCSAAWNHPAGPVSKAGAVTWCDGQSGIPAGEPGPGVPVSATNSLVGTSVQDYVGSHLVLALTNGNYVIRSPSWNDPGTAVTDVGAVTWGSGTSGVVGAISAANSLIGTSPYDVVGLTGITALTNGNYVVRSREWRNGTAMDAGAVTWGNGSTGVKGAVSAANSLIGAKAGDNIGGDGVIPLTNGHYVVVSPFWDSPSATGEDHGAVTWGNGSSGIKGLVSAANSLVGGTNSDRVGNSGVTALTNGNYVVASRDWDNPAGPVTEVGAATWGNGNSGIKGLVSATNSLIGGFSGDSIGSAGVIALKNGHYVVCSPYWDNPATTADQAGAVTWGSGTAGIKGLVSAANSLVGTSNNDVLGNGGVTALANGDYVVFSGIWDNPVNPMMDSGAITLGNGTTGITGPVIAANSVLGGTDNQGTSLTFGYDRVREQLIVGRPGDLTVTRMGNLFRALSKTGSAAPGALDISFGTPGTAAINEAGAMLADFSLTGAGSTGGRNKALFADPIYGGAPEMVVQLGDNLAGLGGGLPNNAKATVLSSHVTQQSGRGLFFATVSGTGITTSSNRLLLRDNGSSISLLRRTGQFIPALGLPSAFREVVQNHDYDLLVLSYQLKASATAPVVTSTSDTGLLPLTHGGSIINANLSAQEGRSAFGGTGVFGEFSGRAVVGGKETIHFAAALKTGATSVPALFKMDEDGGNPSLTAKGGGAAPGAGAAFASFPALTQTGNGFGGEQGERALFKATLSGAPSTSNEGLWREGKGSFLVRKGVTEVLPGVKVAGILRFWPAGPDQVLFHAKLSGTGVTSANNEALVLRQTDNAFLILLRKGASPPGIGTAKISAISAVDVNPVSGTYAVLTTLTGSPSTSNQALWTGCTGFGDDTIGAFRRLPQLRLRKGDHYSTDATPIGLVKSISLKPAVDATGAGGRGLAQAISSYGDLALYLIGAGNQTELVVLPRFIANK